MPQAWLKQPTYSVFFQGLQGGKFPPLSFEFLPQTITNFVCFFYILHIFSPHKSNFPTKSTSLKTVTRMFKFCCVVLEVGIHNVCVLYPSFFCEKPSIPEFSVIMPHTNDTSMVEIAHVLNIFLPRQLKTVMRMFKFCCVLCCLHNKLAHSQLYCCLQNMAPGNGHMHSKWIKETQLPHSARNTFTSQQLLLFMALHCKNFLVTLTIFWSPQLHSFCVGDM